MPYVRNFTPETYRASEQNWAVVQDSSGLMYFGNNDYGVLEYDGVNWRQIPLPENPIVRSLAIHKGTIYVGAVNDLGYLAPDPTGMLQYHSLVDQIDSADRSFADVWKIYSIGDEVYFSCEMDRLFIFRDRRLVKTLDIPYSPLFTFPVDGKVVAGSFSEGLLVEEGDTFKTLPGGDFFSLKAVLSILPWKSPWWQVGTIPDGVFLYNPETGEISTEFPSAEANRYLKRHMLYHAISLPGHRVAYATLEGGALVLDSLGNLLSLIDARAGLQNEVVSYLYHNGRDQATNPLWMALSSGIALAETELPIRAFNKSFGLGSSILDIYEHRGVLYLGTLTGLYYLDRRKNAVPRFIPVPAISTSCWTLLPFHDPATGRELLIAGTQQGIFEIRDTNRVISLEDQYHITGRDKQYYQCFSLCQSEQQPGTLYLGLKTGLASISYRDGHWTGDAYFRQVPALEIRSIGEDLNGDLWLGTLGNGITRVEFTGNDTLVKTYGLEDGLPSLKNNRIYRDSQGILFGTTRGAFRFSTGRGSFVPDSILPERYTRGDLGIHRLKITGKGEAWVVVYDREHRWVEHYSTLGDGSCHIDSLPFKTFPNREIDAIFQENRERTWFGISNELFCYQEDHRSFEHPLFHALIRRVLAGTDSVLFNGHLPEGSVLPEPDLPYRMNNLVFDFAAPFFSGEESPRFSYRLAGLQKSWSPWSGDARVGFNNLREGKYEFRVRAINCYGQISTEAIYAFTIAPPWYRSVLALAGYLLLAGLLVSLIVRWNARRLIREKQQLEQVVTERTREVMNQKTEIEKQRDLAQRQKKRIENQNRDIKDSIKYARRIQNAILPPEDYLSDFIPECFVMNLPKDIVSGDFYWFAEKENRLVIAVADCTGHGVPGAFMSMLGMAYLNEIVNKNNIIQPSDILYYLRIYVINSLHQRGEVGESRDGMDISLFTIDIENLKLEYAGAYNPLFILRGDSLHVLKGDRMPIGIHEKMTEHFRNQEYQLQKGDRIYAFSDGYIDQFGGPKNKKLTNSTLKKWLIEIRDKEMHAQREILENRFLEWKGKNAQVDDILMVGLRI